MAGAKDYWRQIARDTATKAGLPADIFEDLIGSESAYNPIARSQKGAVGLGQLMPPTARDLGVNPYNPFENLKGSATYFKKLYDRFGNWVDAIAAYKVGPEHAPGGKSPNQAIWERGLELAKKALGNKNVLVDKTTGKPVDVTQPSPDILIRIQNWFATNSLYIAASMILWIAVSALIRER